MHKYFNFTKIFEAEQMGLPLTPEEMGTPDSPTGQVSSEKLEDFSLLAKENILEVTMIKDDLRKLENGESVLKIDAKWKNMKNETQIKEIKSVILNTKNDTSKNEKDSLVFNLDEEVTENIVNGLGLGEQVLQVLTGFGQAGTEIPKVSVRFINSVNLDTSSTDDVVPATPEQIKDSSVLPNPTAGEIPNESRGFLSFDQFVNEGKKKETTIEKKSTKVKLKTKPKKEGKFPDMSGDGIITKKDILIAKGVITKDKYNAKVEKNKSIKK